MQADSHPAHAIYDLDNTILHQLCWNDWNTGSFMHETEQSSTWLALFVWSAWCSRISLSFHVSVLETDQLSMADHWKSYSLVEHGVNLKNLACII